jgi:co-chaperonin GroES (HSP10)
MELKKALIVVGDRVLLKPSDENGKTDSGLYLPQGVHEREQVQAGVVVNVGPGYPLPDPGSVNDEPWAQHRQSGPQYLPLQARVGDRAIFLRKAAVEIEFDGQKYAVVPQSAILVLEREELTDDDE